MSLLNPEQIAAAQKEHLETLLSMTNKAFQGFEKMVELNLQVGKSLLAESNAHLQKSASAKDAHELLQLQTSMPQPGAEKAMSYFRHLYEIGAATQAEIAKDIEAHAEEHQRRIQALVDNFAKNAPAGSETAVAIMKSTLSAVNAAGETARKTARQAVEMAQSNIAAATKTATSSSKK